ncbi:hypothetical protein ACHAQA_002830 [Verticillium albo-atrum]
MTTSTNGQDAHLTTLPTEVLEQILVDEVLNKTDIKSLRAACRALVPSTTHLLFRQICISKLWSDRHAFLSIAAAPHLAAAVRTVVWYEMAQGQLAVAKLDCGPPNAGRRRSCLDPPYVPEWPFTHEVAMWSRSLFWWPISLVAISYTGSPYKRYIPPDELELLGTVAEQLAAHEHAVREFYPVFLAAIRSMPGFSAGGQATLISAPMPPRRIIGPTPECPIAFPTDLFRYEKQWVVPKPMRNRGYFEFLLPAMHDLACEEQSSTAGGGVDVGGRNAIRRLVFQDECDRQYSSLGIIKLETFPAALKYVTHLDITFRSTIFIGAVYNERSDRPFDGLIRHIQAAPHLTHLRMDFDPYLISTTDPHDRGEHHGEDEGEESMAHYDWDHPRKIWLLLPYMPELVSLEVDGFGYPTPMDHLRVFLEKHAATLRHFHLDSARYLPPSPEEIADIPGLQLKSISVLRRGARLEDEGDDDSMYEEEEEEEEEVEEEYEEDEDMSGPDF